MRRSTRVVSVLAAALFLAAMVASPAHAHAKIIYQGTDSMLLNDGHNYASVCDRENDNRPVTGKVFIGDRFYSSATDPHYGVGCIAWNFPSSVTHIQLCEANHLTSRVCTEKIPA